MNLRRHLASPNATSLWVVVVPSALFGLNIVASPYDEGTLVQWLVVIAAITAVAALALLAVRPLVRRTGSGAFRVVCTLGTYAIVGAVHGLVGAVASGIVDIQPSGPVVTRILVRVAVAVLWFTVIAVVIDEVRTHRAVMDDLRVHVADLRRTQEIERDHLEDVLLRIRQEAAAPVLAALERLRIALEPLADGTGQIDSALRLGRLIDHQVRTLGNRLMVADGTLLEHSPIDHRVPIGERARSVVRAVASRPLHHPLVAAVLYEGSVSAFMVTAQLPFVLILSNAIVGGGNLILGALAANRLLGPRLAGRPTAVRLASGIGVALLIASSGMVIFAILSGVFAGETVWVWATLPTYTIIMLIFGIAAGLGADRREQEERLEAIGRELAWSTARIAQRVRHERRLLGAWLHGPTQSALLALVRRLEAASPADLPRVAEGALPDLVTVTESVQRLIDGDDAEAVELDAALRNLARMWRGALDVQVQVDDDVARRLQADSGALAVVIDVVAEALANAARHGEARRAQVALDDRPAAGLVEVTVTDDGVLDDLVEPGGGSRLLGEVAIRWSLGTSEDGRTELKAQIPCGSRSGTAPVLAGR